MVNRGALAIWLVGMVFIDMQCVQRARHIIAMSAMTDAVCHSYS